MKTILLPALFLLLISAMAAQAGEHLRLAAVGDEGKQLWIMDSQGKSRKMLVAGEEQIGPPCWSPEGHRIAYIQGKKVNVVDMGTSRVEEVAVLPDNAYADARMDWSPDGRLIAFGSVSGLYLLDMQNRTFKKIAKSGWSVSFTRDGKRLVFFDGDFEGGYIYSMGTDGRGRKKLSRLEGSYPALDRTTGRIAFVHKSTEIWATNEDGSNPRKIWRGRGVLYPKYLSWSPDGKELACRGESEKGTAVYIITISSGNVKRITAEKERCDMPVWSPGL